MKMFKKIMAVALTAVMAVSMLTGCALTDAVRDKAVEKALESKLSGNGVEVKVSTTGAKEYTDVVDAVKKELKSDANKDKVPTEVVITTTVTKGYVAVVVKASNKSNNVKNDLEDADVALLKACLTDKTKDSAKLKIATGYFEGLKEAGKTAKCDYVIIVAKVAA